MAQIPSTPRPTTTTPTERRKTPPSTPSKPAPSAPKDRFIDKALEKARKGGDADKGATEASKAATDKVKKDPINNAIIGAVETVKTKAGEIKAGYDKVERTVNKAAKDLADDAKEVVGKAAEAAKPLIEPSIREVKEAGREIGTAAKKTSDSWNKLTNLDEHPEVQAVRDSDLDGVNKNILIAKEKIENGIQAGFETLNNAGKVVDEVIEGGFEILINNPITTAQVQIGKAAVDGVKELGSSIGGWFSDRISGGAEGAVKAGKTVSDTNKAIEDRTKAQQAENDREIGAAADKLADSWNNLDPSKHAEVEAVRNSDLDGVNKNILIAKETVENGIQNGFAVLSNLGDLGDEYIEAGLENIGTELQNTGDAIVGGAKAVGDFVGGLFG